MAWEESQGYIIEYCSRFTASVIYAISLQILLGSNSLFYHRPPGCSGQDAFAINMPLHSTWNHPLLATSMAHSTCELPDGAVLAYDVLGASFLATSCLWCWSAAWPRRAPTGYASVRRGRKLDQCWYTTIGGSATPRLRRGSNPGPTILQWKLWRATLLS
ncbi:hypothetical protein C8R46DRAFT_448985 [Mycena filopes]|nr:hypothetical protein C8R46DRAFT_448985 [Mycena filopes]